MCNCAVAAEEGAVEFVRSDQSNFPNLKGRCLHQGFLRIGCCWLSLRLPFLRKPATSSSSSAPAPLDNGLTDTPDNVTRVETPDHPTMLAPKNGYSVCGRLGSSAALQQMSIEGDMRLHTPLSQSQDGGVPERSPTK